jgi:type IV pilus assembly protein PilV
MKNTLSTQQGFTLVEVMIAMFILGVALMTLITMQVTGIRGNSTASRISTAADRGSSQVEAIFGMSYDLEPRLTAAMAANYTAADANHKLPVSADGYSIYWNVVNDQPLPNLKSIQVIINRLDQGQAKSITMNYIKSKY